MVPRLNGLVEAECRQLLSVAATRIFSNFWLLHPVEAPRFPFGELLQPITTEVEVALGDKVAEHVEVLQNICSVTEAVRMRRRMTLAPEARERAMLTPRVALR